MFVLDHYHSSLMVLSNPPRLSAYTPCSAPVLTPLGLGLGKFPHSQLGDINEHTPLLQPIPCFHHLTVADTSAAVAFHCLRYLLAAVEG